MRKIKKFLSLVLALSLLVGIAPMSVFALECTPETEHAVLITNSYVANFDVNQTPAASDISTDTFIEGAVYRIVQTQGAYNPATQVYGQADSNINFEFTIDFTADTIIPQGLDGSPLENVSVSPIRLDDLNDDQDFTYRPLVNKGMRVVLPDGTYELTEIKPVDGFDTYDIRGWDRDDETSPVFRTERDGTGEGPSIVLEIPRTNANGECEGLEAWVNFKAIPTLVDIEITKLDGESPNKDQPLGNAVFHLLALTDPAELAEEYPEYFDGGEYTGGAYKKIVEQLAGDAAVNPNEPVDPVDPVDPTDPTDPVIPPNTPEPNEPYTWDDFKLTSISGVYQVDGLSDSGKQKSKRNNGILSFPSFHYNGSPVTAIGEFAFVNSQLTSVDLTKLTALETIGDSAFKNTGEGGLPASGAPAYGNKITHLNLSGLTTLTNIGSYAFSNNELTFVSFNGLTALKTIGNNAFEYNQLDTVDFAGITALETIGDYAFYKNQLTTLELSGLTALKTIGGWAFSSNQLTTLELSGLTALETIGENAFYDNQLTTLELSELTALETIGELAFAYNQLTALDLSGLTALKTIGYSAFRNNKLTSLDLSGLTALKTIERWAFESNQLTTLDLSGLTALETIDGWAFRDNQLTTVDFSDLINLTSLHNQAFTGNKPDGITTELVKIIPPEGNPNNLQNTVDTSNGGHVIVKKEEPEPQEEQKPQEDLQDTAAGLLFNEALWETIERIEKEYDYKFAVLPHVVNMEQLIGDLMNDEINQDPAYLANWFSGVAVSDSQTGIAKFENIPYGEYIVVEVTPPDAKGPSGQGYHLSPVVHHFTVSSNNYSEEKTEDGEYLFKKDVVNYLEPVVKKGIEGSSTVYPGSAETANIQFFERQEVFNYTLDIELPNDIATYEEFVITDVNQNPGKIDFGTAQEIVYYNKAEAAQLRNFENGLGGIEPAGTTIFTNTSSELENIANASTSFANFATIVANNSTAVLEQQFANNTLTIRKPAIVKETEEAQNAAWAAQFPEGGILRIKVPAKFTSEAVVKTTGHLNTFTLDYVASPVAKGKKTSNEVKTNPKSMELKLIKTNSANEGEENFQKLDGARFTLKPVKGRAAETLNIAANTRDIVMNFGDGQDPNQPALGEIVVQNLDFGTYELTEVKAPEGYRLLDKPIKVELVEGDDVSLILTIKNYLTDEFLPATGTGLMVSVAVIGAGTLAGALVLGRKKEEDEE